MSVKIVTLEPGYCSHSYQVRGWTFGLSNLDRSKGFISYLKLSERLWGPSRFLLIGYLGQFPGGKVAGAWGWPLISI